MFTGQPMRMKQVNEAIVREALHVRGRATKADLGLDTGLSLPTVAQALSAMETQGEIRAAGLKESFVGRKATEYELDASAGSIYAIALEHDRLDWAIANGLGTVVSRGGRLVRSDPVAEAIDLAEAMKRDIAFPKAGRCVLALGVPGAVHDGRVLTGDFNVAWGDADIGAYFSDRTGMSVVVENDINAAALGYERRLEANGRKPHSLVYIFFNGLCTGSGIVCGGQVIRGATNFAGELDYLPLRNGMTLRETLPSVRNDRKYIVAIVSMLAAVNCVVNPALFVIGGIGFRFDLADAVEIEYNSMVASAIRPRLVFEQDTMSHYLFGLCGMAFDAMFPAFRLIAGRN